MLLSMHTAVASPSGFPVQHTHPVLPPVAAGFPAGLPRSSGSFGLFSLDASLFEDPAGKLESRRLQPHLQANTEQSSSHQTGGDASSHRAAPPGDCCTALGSPSRPGASCKQAAGACSATVPGQNEACVQLPREGPPQSSAQARNSSPPCPLALQHAWGRSGWQRQLGKAKRPRRVTEPEPFPLCSPAGLRPRKAEGPLHAGSKQQGKRSLLPPADLLVGSPWGTRTGPCSDVPDKSPTGTEQNRSQCVLGAPSAPAPCGG